MINYSIRDAILDLYEEHARIQEKWNDPVSERYQQTITAYENELKDIEKMLSVASNDLEELKRFYQGQEEDDAQHKRALYKRL